MKYNMLGNANSAGPVRLSDAYSSLVGGASQGVAASQKALYNAYNSLNSRLQYQVTIESVSADGTAPYAWSYSKTKTGYKSIAYSLISSGSGGITWNAQGLNMGGEHFSCSGFASTQVWNGRVVVTWVKS